jgi:hypothetical protein
MLPVCRLSPFPRRPALSGTMSSTRSSDPVRFGPSRHRVFRCLRYGHLPSPGSLFGTMASADSPPSCLGGASPGKNALVAIPLRFIAAPAWRPVSASLRLPARPPHLPPRLNPRLRCVVPVRRIVAGLPMRFLFIGPPVSSSLPPASRLPFQRWLQVVVLSHFHVTVLLQGTFTPFTTRPCWAHTRKSRLPRVPLGT